MEGHAALPDADDVERVLSDRVEAVDQDPAEPAADDHADCGEENEVVDIHRFPGRARHRSTAAGEPPAGDEADDVHEAIPVDLHRADRKCNRVDVGIRDHAPVTRNRNARR
jgi:hypothetical protein